MIIRRTFKIWNLSLPRVVTMWMRIGFGLNDAQYQGVCKKKIPYTGLFYFDKVSWSLPPSPILPKKEINYKTKHRPYAYIWPKSSVWPPLHLSSHNHPPEMRPRQVKVTLYDISLCCKCNKIFMIRLWFISTPIKQIFIAPYHISKYNWLQWMRHKGGADINILTVCDNIEACLAWKPGGCPDV